MVGDQLGRVHTLANSHVSFLTKLIFADSSMEVVTNPLEKLGAVPVVVVVAIDLTEELPADEKATSSF